ncbi:MAG: hypothetical protein C4316_05720 [Chloroflexota bacterium]
MSTRTELRARLRRELKDEDPAAQRWSDAELDPHLDRALSDLSVGMPREQQTDLTMPGGTREVDLSGLAGLLVIEAVEYPAGMFPPAYVGWVRRASTLTLLVDSPPAAGEQVRVYWLGRHTLTDTGSTLSPDQEELLLLGAAGYAVRALANHAINRVNLTRSAQADFLKWAEATLARFRSELARRGRTGRLRPSRLYTPTFNGGKGYA